MEISSNNASTHNCTEHFGDPVSAWCEQCEIFVCLKCIVSANHSGHAFKAIEKIKEERRRFIESKTGELKYRLEEYSLALKDQIEEEEKFDAKIVTINSEIDTRSQELQSYIKSWENNMTSVLTEKVTKEKGKIETLKKEIINKQDKLRSFLETEDYDSLKTVDDILNTAGNPPSLYVPRNLTLKTVGVKELNIQEKFGTLFFEDTYSSDCEEVRRKTTSQENASAQDVTHRDVRADEESGHIYHAVNYADMDNKNVDTYDQKVKGTKSNDNKLDDAVVDNKNVDNDDKEAGETSANDKNVDDIVEGDLEISDRFQYNFPEQKGKEIRLAPNKKGGVWITWLGSRYIKHFSNEGQPGKTHSTKFEIFDIGVNNSDDLFATVHRGCRVKRKGVLSWKTLINTYPLLSQGLSITKKNEILVCLQDEAFGKIGRYSQDGQCIQTVSLGDDPKKSLSCPTLVQGSLETDDIIVIDGKDVLCVHNDGKIKSVWCGHDPERTELENKTTEENREPVSITFDSDGFLFILDTGNKRITVFDKTLHFTCNIKDSHFPEMSGATFDTQGQLWIACSDGILHKMRVKAHSLCEQ